MKAVELYAGAGGLAMGVSLAGFKSLAVVEWDKWACDTLRENKRRGFPLVADWPVHEGDVRKFDWSSLESEEIDLLAGGPPCQPFSMGGKHQAHDDTRDMFPATVDIVRRLRPKAFIVENVKGLTRSTFANYYQYILLQLEFPEVPARRNEDWFDHLLRLQVERTSGRQNGKRLTYNVVPTLVNAADYGVPQKRERVFIVGFRSDLGVDWSFPRQTHSYDRLLHDQWVSGEYWERHGVARRNRPTMPSGVESRVRRLASSLLFVDELPWRTVRDAIAGLPNPQSRTANNYSDHRFQPGARVYPGHTGSPLDLPAKTLKAGDHGVPGGENMLVNTDGSVRYFSIRESARVQTFPDGFVFHGSWTETMRQLGNAVPVALGHVVARSVAEKLALVQLDQLARQRAKARGAA
ncbi:DNA cytosine methyltransferase [Burkholderia cenocepacia]|uniref:DNA cytosine methyltransferase n=1 Tax=Burkholderia cenocepacia TaxID=95486 RepID=UPI0024B7FF61|nr:DNA cytosine methyltransferase [Burkholderia cenocepacia]MDI9694978.1 DNA cytosine methyltransferase [Burkholderia cenocepacia]